MADIFRLVPRRQLAAVYFEDTTLRPLSSDVTAYLFPDPRAYGNADALSRIIEVLNAWPIENPSGWQSLGEDDKASGDRQIWCACDRFVGELPPQFAGVLRLRVRTAVNPTPVESANSVDPRDGDGWVEAVAEQGVQITNYGDYLNSTHMELLRIERLTGKCDRCREVGRTQLHHVSYQRLGAELPGDTRELCNRCHILEHPRTVKRERPQVVRLSRAA